MLPKAKELGLMHITFSTRLQQRECVETRARISQGWRETWTDVYQEAARSPPDRRLAGKGGPDHKLVSVWMQKEEPLSLRPSPKTAKVTRKKKKSVSDKQCCRKGTTGTAGSGKDFYWCQTSTQPALIGIPTHQRGSTGNKRVAEDQGATLPVSSLSLLFRFLGAGRIRKF